MALVGTEVKSLRDRQASISESFARIVNEEVLLYNMQINPYEHGNRFNHDPDRPRRLLLHRREIDRLRAQIELKRRTLIPLSVYLKRGLVKVEIGLCKGKQQLDKREELKRRAADREAERAIARHR